MSLPTNECKTNQFCSNGLLFIKLSQRLKESKKRDASRVEKQPSQISVASIFQKQKETSSGGD